MFRLRENKTRMWMERNRLIEDVTISNAPAGIRMRKTEPTFKFVL